MEIFRISAIALISAFCILLLKDTRSDVALLIGITGGVIILLSLLDYFADIFTVIKMLMDKAQLNDKIIAVIFKIIGIGYITDFSAGIIEDSGSKSLADKVILGGKLMILVLSLPIITTLFEVIVSLFV